jgi:hypothetical protein
MQKYKYIYVYVNKNLGCIIIDVRNRTKEYYLILSSMDAVKGD